MLRTQFSKFTLLLALVAACAAGTEPVWAEDCHASESSAGPITAEVKAARYSIVSQSYDIPSLTLLDENGHEFDLAGTLEGSRPVAVNFIFTTCTTICPVMSATFGKLSRVLGDESGDLLMVSISIDPEYDAVPRLKQYLETFRAPENWTFLTGTREEISTILRAFNALTGSKMNHKPLTFFRVPHSDDWQRVEGLASAGDLAREYRQLLER